MTIGACAYHRTWPMLDGCRAGRPGAYLDQHGAWLMRHVPRGRYLRSRPPATQPACGVLGQFGNTGIDSYFLIEQWLCPVLVFIKRQLAMENESQAGVDGGH